MFEEDFYVLLKTNETIVKDKRKFKGLLNDYFPQEKWKRNIVHFLYEMGIMEEIEQRPKLSKQMILRYKNMVIDQYGTLPENAEWAVKVWYDSYGKLIAEKRKKEEEKRKYNRTNKREENKLLREIERISNLESLDISGDVNKIFYIFDRAPLYPEVFRKLYLIYRAVEAVDKYYLENCNFERNSIITFCLAKLMFNNMIKKNRCNYDDYMELFQKLLDIKANELFLLYGMLCLGIGKETQDSFIQTNLEGGIQWIIYFYENLIKRGIVITGKFISNIGNTEFLIGAVYTEGKCVKKDTAKGREYWNIVLNRSESDWDSKDKMMETKTAIGLIYTGYIIHFQIGEKTIDVKARCNYKKAYKILISGAEYGNENALDGLARMYDLGNYVEQNVDQAIKLYNEAIARGSILAIVHLAELYEKGKNIEKNLMQAIKLYKRAAEHDNEDAKKWLMKHKKIIKKYENRINYNEEN